MGGSSKKQTIGYRIYLGMHMILCHGPIDFLHQIKFGGKPIGMTAPTSTGLTFSKEDLFGGEEREGGISGRLDIQTGAPTQGQNDYLVSLLGDKVPAFRGVCGVIFRKMYLGMSPYLKRPAFRVTRIHKRSDGSPQWYDAKAQIGAIVDSTDSDSTTKVVEKFIFEITADFERTFVTASNEGMVSTWLQSGYTEEAPSEGGGSTFGIAPGPFGALVGQYESSYRDGFLLRKWFDPTAIGVPVDGKLHINVGYATSVAVYLNNVELPLTYGSANEASAIIDAAGLPNPSFISMVAQTLIDGTTPYASLSISGTFNETTTTYTPTKTGNADMNPAHIVHECLTDKNWGMGYNYSDIDYPSFTAAADALYDEGMGISTLWDKQTPIEDFIKEIVKHIDGVLYVDRRTGQFKFKLIRNDYDPATLTEFGPHNVERLENYKVVSDGEFVNEVVVKYRNGETSNEATAVATDPALYQMQGTTISSTMQYLGFSNGTNAMRAAQRDLKTLSSPLISCVIYAYGIAEDFNPGDVLKLSWPDYGLQSVVMRVTQVAIGSGKGQRVRLSVIQDSFGLPDLMFLPPAGEFIPPSFELPTEANLPSPYRLVTEAPYFEMVAREGQATIDNLLSAAPEAGYIIAAGTLAGSAFSMTLYSNSGAGYESRATVDFSPTAKLAMPMTKMTTVIAISNAERVGQAAIGSHCQIGNELCAVVARSDSQLTLRRGVLDTVPEVHPFGARIMFWDAFGGTDEVEYAAGETVAVKLVTGSPGASFNLAPIPADSVTLDSRAIRPYPPGNVQINGQFFPDRITGDLVMTWASRNRRQQTSANLIGFTDGDITPEAGTTYNVRVYDENDVLIKTTAGLTDKSFAYTEADELADSSRVNGRLRIELESERDGYVSWQKHSITLKRAGYGFNYGDYYGGI